MKICGLICGLKYEQALRYLAEGDASSIKYDPASDSFSIEPHYREGDYMISGDHSYYIKIINGRLVRQYFDGGCMYFRPGEVSKYVHVRDGRRVEPPKKHPLCKYIYKHIAGEPFMVKIDDMWHNSITLKSEELTFGVDIECGGVGVKSGYSFSELSTVITTWVEPLLKVGDMVRVCQHPSGDNMKYNNTEGFDNVWVAPMNEYVSVVAEIVKIVRCGVELSGMRCYYPPSALVKV